MIKLPQNNWLQYNKSDRLGDIDESFNCDVNKNEGVIEFTRTKKTFSVDDNEDFDSLPVAFNYYGNDLWVHTRVDGSWSADTSPSPEDTYTKDTDNNAPDDQIFDSELFNGDMYVSTSGLNDARIHKLSSSTWSTVTTSLDSSSQPLLKTYGNRLYYTHENTKVGSLNTSDTLATTTFTLDVGLTDDYILTILEAGNDRLWIGANNTSKKDGYLYEWDGATQNTFTRQYYSPSGVVAGTVVGNLPYIIDGKGRLLTVSGGGLKELARFPSTNEFFDDAFSLNLNNLFVHHNGIIPFEDKILIHINTRKNRSTNTPYVQEKCPSGVWEYSETTGLSHKFSVTLDDVDSSTATQYGQQGVDRVGALYIFNELKDIDKNGTLLIGANALNTSSTSQDKPAVFINETTPETKRSGYIVTPKVFSENTTDIWKNVFTQNEVLDDGDKYILKYKVKDTEPVQTDIAFLSSNMITTDTDISDYEVGDEIRMLYGYGAGSCRSIKSMEQRGIYWEVKLDDDVFTASASDTAWAIFDKFKKAGEWTQDTSYCQFPVEKDNSWIQFKLIYEGMGRAKLYNVLINNVKSKSLT